MIRFWIAKGHRGLLQLTGGLVVVSFLFTTICAPFAQANLYGEHRGEPLESQNQTIWSERRKAARKFLSGGTLKSGELAVSSNEFLTSQVPRPQNLTLELAQLPSNLEPFSPTLLSHNFTQNFSSKYNIPKSSPHLAQVVSALNFLPGSIRKISVPQGKQQGTIVLHIQDVHLNQEAQSNIGKIIQGLVNEDKVALVALEGAFERIVLKRFRNSPYQEAIQKAADYLLRENKISGAIHTAFTSGKEIPPMVGIDDEAHYEANVAAYKKSYKLASGNLKEILAIQRDMENEKEKVFNVNLRVFDQKAQNYHAGKIKLAEYLEFLVQQTRAEDQTVQNFLKAWSIESSLDFKQVEKERSVLIQALVQNLNVSQIEELTQTTLAYRLGQFGYADYYRHIQNLCKSNRVNLSEYPLMAQYIQYTLLSDSINPEKLFKAIKTFEDQGYKHLAKTVFEKELVFKSKQLYLTRKLLEFTLTPEEWKEYEKVKDNFSLQSFEEFYREAKFRDQAMAENLLKQMELHQQEVKVVVLVTGGFHSEGIETRLTQEGITVINFAPKMTKVEIEKGAAHLSVFTQEKTPLEKLFTGEKLTLPPKTFPKHLPSLAAALVIGFLTIWSPQMMTSAQANTLNRIHLGPTVAQELKVEKVERLKFNTSQVIFKKPNGAVKLILQTDDKKNITAKEEKTIKSFGFKVTQPGALGLWKMLGIHEDLMVIGFIEGLITVLAMLGFMPHAPPEFTLNFAHLILQHSVFGGSIIYGVAFILHLLFGIQQPNDKILRWAALKGSDKKFEKAPFREAVKASFHATNIATIKSSFQVLPVIWIGLFLPNPWAYIPYIVAAIFGAISHSLLNYKIISEYEDPNLDLLTETYSSNKGTQTDDLEQKPLDSAESQLSRDSKFDQEENKYVYDSVMKKVIVDQLETEFAFPHSTEFINTRKEIEEIFQRLLKSAIELLEEKGKIAQLVGLEEMKIYLSDTEQPNAFAVIHHNFMIFNIGTMLKLSQEELLTKDAVAFILAHELSHLLQYRDDVDEGKINREEVKFKSLKDHLKEKFHENQDRYAREQDADIRALEIVNRAGYNMSATVAFFEAIIDEYSYSFEDMFAEHPSPQTRVAYIKKILRASNWRETQTMELFSKDALEEINGPKSLFRRRQTKLSLIESQEGLLYAIEHAQTIEELELLTSWTLNRVLELESKKLGPLVWKMLKKRKDKILKRIYHFIFRADRINFYTHLWIHKTKTLKEGYHDDSHLLWYFFNKHNQVKKLITYFLFTYLATDEFPLYEASDRKKTTYNRTKGAWDRAPLFIEGYGQLVNAISSLPKVQETIELRNRLLQKIKERAIELENGNRKSLQLARLEILRMNPILAHGFLGIDENMPKDKIKKIEKSLETITAQYSLQETVELLKKMVPFRGIGFERVNMKDEVRRDFNNYLDRIEEARWKTYEFVMSYLLKRLVLNLKNPSLEELFKVLDLLLVKKREFLGQPTPKIDFVARGILKMVRKTHSEKNQNQIEDRALIKEYFAKHWQIYPLREIGEFFYEELLKNPNDSQVLELLKISEQLRGNVFRVLTRALRGSSPRPILFEEDVMKNKMERIIQLFQLKDEEITELHAVVANRIAKSNTVEESRNRFLEIEESFLSLERSRTGEKPLEYDALSQQLAKILFHWKQLTESETDEFNELGAGAAEISNKLNPSEIDTINEKTKKALIESGFSLEEFLNINLEIKKIIYFFYIGGVLDTNFLSRFARNSIKQNSIDSKELELLARFLNSPRFRELQNKRGIPQSFSVERVKWGEGFRGFYGSLKELNPDAFLLMQPFYKPQTWEEYIYSFNLLVYLNKTKQKKLVLLFLSNKIMYGLSMFLGELWDGEPPKARGMDANFYLAEKGLLKRMFEGAFSRIIFGIPKYIDRRDLALDNSWKKLFFNIVFKSEKSFEEMISEIKTFIPAGVTRNYLLLYLLARRIKEIAPSFKLRAELELEELRKTILSSVQSGEKQALVLDAIEKISPLLIRDHRIDFINLKLLSYWFLKKDGKRKSDMGEKEKEGFDYYADNFLGILIEIIEKLYELWKKSDLNTFLRFTIHIINYMIILPFYILQEARLLPKFIYKLVVCIIFLKSSFEAADHGYLTLKNKLMEIVLAELYRERVLMRLFRKYYLWFQVRFRKGKKLTSIFYFDFQGKQTHLDTGLADFAQDHIMEKIHSPNLSFEERKSLVVKFFPIATPTRDKYLETLAEEEISRQNQTQNDLLENLKVLRTLFANPYLKDHYSFICLELERKINPGLYRKILDQSRDNPEAHFKLIQNYVELLQAYFEVGYIRDDLLFSVLAEARTHEEYLLLRPLFYQYRMDGIQDKKKADSFYYQDRISLLLQEANPEEKKELLLWVLGFQEKPLFLSEWEIFVGADLGHLREVFRGNGKVPFKEEENTVPFLNVGISVRKEMVRQLLVGNKGILTNKKVFQNLMNTIFDSLVTKEGEISKKKIKKIMKSVIRNLDNERLLEMTQSLSVSLALTDGAEDESVVIAKFFESLGVIGIKIAQILAHSYDISMSDELRDRLRDLSSGADPSTKILAFETIQNIYPGGFNAHFETLGDMIGSASVKVVYKVKRKGFKVDHVLKIKRPDVSQRISKDLEFLKAILKDLRRKGFSISPGLEDEVAKAIERDADFKRELEITEEFNEQIQKIQEEADYRLEDGRALEFSVAHIHSGSIQNDVTMETDFASGISLDKEKEAILSGRLSENEAFQIKKIILDFLMRQMFQYGFYLSDPHGGNFHILKEDGKIKIILIDNGSGEKLEEGQKNKEELLEAMIWLSVNPGKKIPSQYLSASIFFGKLGYLKRDLTSLEFLTLIFKYLKIARDPEVANSSILTPEEYMEFIKEKFSQKMTLGEKFKFLLRKKWKQPAAGALGIWGKFGLTHSASRGQAGQTHSTGTGQANLKLIGFIEGFIIGGLNAFSITALFNVLPAIFTLTGASFYAVIFLVLSLIVWYPILYFLHYFLGSLQRDNTNVHLKSHDKELVRDAAHEATRTALISVLPVIFLPYAFVLFPMVNHNVIAALGAFLGAALHALMNADFYGTPKIKNPFSDEEAIQLEKIFELFLIRFKEKGARFRIRSIITNSLLEIEDLTERELRIHELSDHELLKAMEEPIQFLADQSSYPEKLSDFLEPLVKAPKDQNMIRLLTPMIRVLADSTETSDLRLTMVHILSLNSRVEVAESLVRLLKILQELNFEKTRIQEIIGFLGKRSKTHHNIESLIAFILEFNEQGIKGEEFEELVWWLATRHIDAQFIALLSKFILTTDLNMEFSSLLSPGLEAILWLEDKSPGEKISALISRKKWLYWTLYLIKVLTTMKSLSESIGDEVFFHVAFVDMYHRAVVYRSLEETEIEGKFRHYYLNPLLIKVRSLLLEMNYGGLRELILKERIEPAFIISAALMNHQQTIISQTTDLVNDLLRSSKLLKGLTPYKGRNRMSTSFNLQNLQQILENLGIFILDTQVERMVEKEGFRVADLKDRSILVPMVFNSLLSAYRGSNEVDHKEANYLTHSLETAVVPFAIRGGGAHSPEEDKNPFGADAFHEFDLAFFEMEGRSHRAPDPDTNVPLAFHYYDVPLPEYARKRTVKLGENTIAGTIQILLAWQLKERRAKQNINKIFKWIMHGELKLEELAISLNALRQELEMLKGQCGLKKEYFDAVFGYMDEPFFKEVLDKYQPNKNNTPLLTRLLMESMQKVQLIETPQRNGTPEKRVPHPWLNPELKSRKTLLAYFAYEEKVRKGTFDELDISTINLDFIRLKVKENLQTKPTDSTTNPENLKSDDLEMDENSSQQSGAILVLVKMPVMWFLQKLFPKIKREWVVSYIYDLTVVFWLENLLLYYFVKPHLPLILDHLSPLLLPFGLDSISLNTLFWGLFFALHLVEFFLLETINWLEYLVFQTGRSPRAPPKENMIVAAIVSILSALYSSSPNSLEAFAIHFLANFSAFLISINIFGIIKNRIETLWLSRVLKGHYEIGRIVDVSLIKKGRNGFTYWITTKDYKTFILSYRKVKPDFVDFESLIRGASHREGLIAKFIPAANGKNYVLYKEGIITLEENLGGRQGKWGEFKGGQLEDLAYFLVQFQEATAEHISSSISPTWIYKLPVILLDRLEDTQKKFEVIYAFLRARGPPRKLSELEQIFLEHYPFFMEQLEILKNNMKAKLGELELAIVHGDYHPLNILLSNDIIRSIVDFGYSHIGPRIFDLANPITETDHRFDWNKAKRFVQAYNNFSKRALTKIEREALPDMYRRLYLQSILMVGDSMVRKAKWDLKHRKRILVNAIEFLEHMHEFPWQELPGPADTAEHHKVTVQTYGNDAEFALEISENAFSKDGKGRVFFDRVQNHTYVDDEEIEFGSQELNRLKSDIGALKEKYERDHPDYEVLEVLPNGNLGFNDWFVGIINGKIYRHAREALTERTYSMVVTKKDERPKVMELHFKENSGSIRAYDDQDQDITDQIQTAFFGQQIVENGEYNLANITEQFDDVRHLLRLPMFRSNKFPGDGRFYFGFSDGRGELLDHNKDRLDDAARGGAVSLSLRPLMEAGISPEERERVFEEWGYKNVTGIEGKSYLHLNLGEYFIEPDYNQIIIKFYPGVHPHTLVGFTKEGKILTARVQGITDHAGATIREMAFDLVQQGAKDVFLWANGKDTVEAVESRTQALELLMIVRKKGGGGESLEDLKIKDSAQQIINILQGTETYLDIDTIRGVVQTESFEEALKSKVAEYGLELTEEEATKSLLAAVPQADVDKSNADLYIIRETILDENLQKILSSIQSERTTILVTESTALKAIIEQKIGDSKLNGFPNIFVLSAEESPEGSLIKDGSTLVLKNLHDLLTTHHSLKTVIPQMTGLNIAVDSSLSRDYEGLPEDSLLRSKNTIYLLLNELFKAMPVRAIDLEPIDRIARIVASSA